jgi:hypothetical protein
MTFLSGPRRDTYKNHNLRCLLVVKGKFPVIALCALLALVTVVRFARRGGRPHAAATNRHLVVAPDGTIVTPPNDYVTFFAEAPKPNTATSPTNTLPTK